jgi:hypothetical protein
MIPYLKAKIAEAFTPETQRAIVREYLQMRILYSLQSAGAMIPLAFHGGTALRILYQLPRYSEDLDFALERQREQYDFRRYLTIIQRDLTAETYDVEVKLNERSVVHSTFILGAPIGSNLAGCRVGVDEAGPVDSVGVDERTHGALCPGRSLDQARFGGAILQSRRPCR